MVLSYGVDFKSNKTFYSCMMSHLTLPVEFLSLENILVRWKHLKLLSMTLRKWCGQIIQNLWYHVLIGSKVQKVTPQYLIKIRKRRKGLMWSTLGDCHLYIFQKSHYCYRAAGDASVGTVSLNSVFWSFMVFHNSLPMSQREVSLMRGKDHIHLYVQGQIFKCS